MLNRISIMKEAIVFTTALMRPDLTLPETDWEVIKNALPLLKFFYEVTVEVSGENYVSASLYIVYAKLIRKKLDAYVHAENIADLLPISNLLESLKEEMRHRFSDVESNYLLCEATILDPRFKKNGFSDFGKFERAATALKRKISSITLPTEEPTPSTSGATPRTATFTSTSSLWDDFDAEVSHQIPHNPVAAGIVEFDRYMREPIIKRKENPLKWWKERRSLYPHLYSFMLKRLNMTATSVPCERVFSKAGLILNQKRTRLTTKKLSQLVFISSN